MTNHLSIKLMQRLHEQKDNEPQYYSLGFQFLIDNEIYAHYACDPSALLELLEDTNKTVPLSQKYTKQYDRCEKSYYFWNCSCGIPDCANLEPCVLRHYANDILTIVVPDPITSSNYPVWQHNHKKVVWRFSRQQLVQQMHLFLQQLNDLLNTTPGIVHSYDCNFSGYDDYEVAEDYAANLYYRLASLEN